MIAADPRIALPSIVSAAALRRHDRSRSIVRLSGAALGTGWQVKFVPCDGKVSDQIVAAIQARLGSLTMEMSQWEPTSILSRFNEADAGSWFLLPPDFARVMVVSLDIARRTNGAFDPTHGRAAALLGFGALSPDRPPSTEELDEALARAGWQQLVFDPDEGRVRQPGGLWLDFSGVAKGYAVDAVADLLLGLGIEDALVEIGGELVGRGIKPDGQPWWVDLEQPPTADLQPIRIGLHDLAVATSGEYVRGAHTLDPMTGRSLRREVVSTTVIHSAAIWADAWATALTVLGLERGMELAEQENLAVRMVGVRDGKIIERLSPALIQMIDL